MSVKVKFPSDANKPRFQKAEKASAAAPASVQAKPQSLVQVSYKKDNHHMISHVHALSKGVNHVPEDVWAKAKSSPAVAAMMQSGDISEVVSADPIVEAESDPAPASAEE